MPCHGDIGPRRVLEVWGGDGTMANYPGPGAPTRHKDPLVRLAWGGRAATELRELASAVGGVSGREIAALTGMVRQDFRELMRHVGGKQYSLEVDTREPDPLDWVYILISRRAPAPHHRKSAAQLPPKA